MRWNPTDRKPTQPALWVVAAVASAVGSAAFAAPAPAEEPVSTSCLAEKAGQAAGGYLERIKRLGPTVGPISGDVMTMVLFPREGPVSNTEERLIGTTPLVKDRVVLLFFEEHPEGYPPLRATVVRKFAAAGAAAVVALNAEVESGPFDIPVFHTHEASDGIDLNDYSFAGPRMPFVWYGVEARINAGDFAAVNSEGIFVAAGGRKAELVKACGQ